MADIFNVDVAKCSRVSISLADMPLEVVWKILKYTAVSMTTAEMEVDFQEVLTFLSSVCQQWNDIINDPERLFRKQFIEELKDEDPSKCLQPSAHSVVLSNITVGLGKPFDVLEDELFVMNNCEVHYVKVYDLKPLAMLKSSPATKLMGLPPLRRICIRVDSNVLITNLKACDFNKCLYLSGRDVFNPAVRLTEMHFKRVSPVDGRTLAEWTIPKDRNVGAVSICNTTGCLVISDMNRGHILEFNQDGVQTRSIDITGLLADSKTEPGAKDGLEYLFFVSAQPNSKYFAMIPSMTLRVPTVCVIGLQTFQERTRCKDTEVVVLHGPCFERTAGRIDFADAVRTLYCINRADGDRDGAGDSDTSTETLFMFGRDLKLRRQLKLVYDRLFDGFGCDKHFNPRTGRLFACSIDGKVAYFNLLRDDLD